jgi:hypothetical protein
VARRRLSRPDPGRAPPVPHRQLPAFHRLQRQPRERLRPGP